jgi:hypothetical protein
MPRVHNLSIPTEKGTIVNIAKHMEAIFIAAAVLAGAAAYTFNSLPTIATGI